MRKEKIITLNDRGHELTFKIREMPALKLESWLMRAGLLLAGTGAFDGKDVTSAGEAISRAGKVLSQGGISALAQIDYEKAQPLLDDLLACCTRTDAGIEQRLTPETVDGIIEDVRTLFALRKEALALNVGFFTDGVLSVTRSDGTTSPEQSKPKISVRSRH